MKIIVFVGSPIQDGERDVSKKHNRVHFYFVLITVVLYLCVLDDKAGQKVEERESDCRHR